MMNRCASCNRIMCSCTDLAFAGIVPPVDRVAVRAATEAGYLSVGDYVAVVGCSAHGQELNHNGAHNHVR